MKRMQTVLLSVLCLGTLALTGCNTGRSLLVDLNNGLEQVQALLPKDGNTLTGKGALVSLPTEVPGVENASAIIPSSENESFGSIVNALPTGYDALPTQGKSNGVSGQGGLLGTKFEFGGMFDSKSKIAGTIDHQPFREQLDHARSVLKNYYQSHARTREYKDARRNLVSAEFEFSEIEDTINSGEKATTYNYDSRLSRLKESLAKLEASLTALEKMASSQGIGSGTQTTYAH